VYSLVVLRALLTPLQLLPVLLAAALMAAHFMRAGELGPALTSALAPWLLVTRRRWAARSLQLLLLGGGLIWLQTLLRLVQARLSLGQPYLRLALILGTVALLTAAAALLLQTRRAERFLNRAEQSAGTGAATFLLTALLLGAVQLKVPKPMLLLERVAPGFGWVEVLALAAYAGFVAEKLLDPRQVARWRQRVWLLFSIVFFAQLGLALGGYELFQMTAGKLHFPIPAMIVAGPLYRAESFFMPVLFGSTIVLVGPAWCSHLCYLGVWDQLAARRRRKPVPLSPRREPLRWAMLLLVAGAATALRLLGAPPLWAGAGALAFGLLGVALMLVLSRRRGAMVHCVAYCPVGALAAWLGKLSPWRIRIGEGCDGCGLCRLACRYDALNKADIERRRPAISCTLCGDCLASCKDGYLHYTCLGLSPTRSRAAFVVVTVALHAATLGLARI
jgi:ferredoxin